MDSVLDFGASGPIQALPGDIVLCSQLERDTWLSHFVSPPRCIMGNGKFNAESNPAMN